MSKQKESAPLPFERRRQIAELVILHGTVRVGELIQLFGVADETIRRDLDRLSKDGILTRTHGGAVAARTETAYARRAERQMPAKEAIGRLAAKLVPNGSAVILDSGTTMEHVARALSRHSDLMVITNALTNALELLDSPGITVVLTGGLVRPVTRGSVGDLAVATLKGLRVDRAIIATAGWSLTGGLTYPKFEEVAVKRAMMEAADEVILVADHTKYGHDSLVHVAPLSAVQRIVTSPGLTPEQQAEIREHGIELLVTDSGDGSG